MTKKWVKIFQQEFTNFRLKDVVSWKKNVCCSLTRKAICDLKLNGRQSYNTLHTNVINFYIFRSFTYTQKNMNLFQQKYLHVRLNAVCEFTVHISIYTNGCTFSYIISHDDFLSRGYTVFYITTQTVILMVYLAINHLFITTYKRSYHKCAYFNPFKSNSWHMGLYNTRNRELQEWS